MNDKTNGETVIGLSCAAGFGIDKHAFRKDAAKACSTVDFRARSPREISEQLVRDAQSLELTGASFEKDEQFYRNVAANVREAAAFLGQWHDLVEQMKRDAEGRVRVARFDGFVKSQEVACAVAQLVHRSDGAAATTWRTAALAVNEAIQAVRDGLPCDEYGHPAAPEKRT